MSTLYLTHPCFLMHETGLGHPESAARLESIDRILGEPEFAKLVRMQAPKATLDQVRLIHTQKLIDQVYAALPKAGFGFIDADTVLSPESFDAALHAVGAACAAVDAIVAKSASNAFCAVRPPGHHAEPDTAMGFCLFNNVAIAAAHARKVHGIAKIAIVDFDVHHGNGTQAAFAHNPDVLYASTHQFPWYPGTGRSDETGLGNIVNVPLAAGSGSTEFREAFNHKIKPRLEKFAPEFLIISAGFDAHRDDPLGDLNLTEEDYAWVTRELLQQAARHCGGRLISVLEGGYHLEALSRSAAAHVRSLQTQ